MLNHLKLFLIKKPEQLSSEKNKRYSLINVKVINSFGKPASSSTFYDTFFYNFYGAGAHEITSVYHTCDGEIMKYSSLALVAIKKCSKNVVNDVV